MAWPSCRMRFDDRRTAEVCRHENWAKLLAPQRSEHLARDEPAAERHDLLTGCGAREGGRAEVAAPAAIELLEAARAPAQPLTDVHPHRAKAAGDGAAHEPRRSRQHQRRLQLARVPFASGPTAPHERRSEEHTS